MFLAGILLQELVGLDILQKQAILLNLSLVSLNLTMQSPNRLFGLDVVREARIGEEKHRHDEK